MGFAALLLGSVVGAACQRPSAVKAGDALVVPLEGPIGPATVEYVHGALMRAQASQAELVILQIDTPGGLDTSMRAIIRDILASKVPVVGFVAPRGARAASAGTYIVYATHIAAMAPGTNIGAATPIPLAGGEVGPAEAKATNDAVAFIQSLAELRGRNAEWAERAVRNAASLSAEAARAAGVVEVVAPDTASLLRRIDGRSVQLPSGSRRLRSAGIPITTISPSWRNRALATLTNPNVALILMMLGVWGLFFELANPGAIFPGVLGATALLLGLYALHVLPVSWAGLGLILLGLALMVAEAFVPSFGVLGIGGIVALVIGGLLLLEVDVPGFELSPWVVFGAAATTALLLAVLVRYVVKSQRRRVVTGREGLLGQTGEVITWVDGRGVINLDGERWQARADGHLAPGQRVRVKKKEGLVLSVEATSSPREGSET